MMNYQFVANKADLKLTINHIFTEFRQNNFSIKRSVLQDNLALLLTEHRQKWSSLIASLDDQYHTFSFNRFTAIHNEHNQQQKPLFNKYIFPCLIDALDITANKNIANFSIEAKEQLIKDLPINFLKKLHAEFGYEFINTHITEDKLIELVSTYILPTNESKFNDWLTDPRDEYRDYQIPLLCHKFGVDEFSKKALLSINQYPNAFIDDDNGGIEALDWYIEMACYNGQAKRKYKNPIELKNLFKEISEAKELTFSLTVDDDSNGEEVTKWLHLDCNLFQHDNFNIEEPSLFMTNTFVPGLMNQPTTPSQKLLWFANFYIDALDTWDRFVEAMWEVTGGNTDPYTELKGFKELEEKYFQTFHENLKPFIDIVGEDAQTLHKRMPVNLKKVFRELEEQSYEICGDTFLNLREPVVRFDYLKQEIQVSVEDSQNNKVVIKEIQRIAGSLFNFPFKVTWYKTNDLPNKYYFDALT